MEQRDLNLIEQWIDKDAELRRLWEEHLDFERRLALFNNRVYLTAQEERDRKVLQKQKLHGRDQIERILQRIRKETVPGA
jgi:uncharacterized protein YdcH (DUF465 family)